METNQRFMNGNQPKVHKCKPSKGWFINGNSNQPKVHEWKPTTGS